MRSGFILLHRKGITASEWRHPKRTLAWIDFCTMAAFEDYMAGDGVWIRKGEVIASYGFLARRWRTSKGTVHYWIEHWISERKAERKSERCIERDAERFFVLDFAKTQMPSKESERIPERSSERMSEPMKRKEEKQVSRKQINESQENIFVTYRKKILEFEFADEAYADKVVTQAQELQPPDRGECLRKIGVFLRFCRSPGLHDRARVLFAEIAGFVNDRGAMQKQLTDEERQRREEFRESVADQ